jgi:hypothetical protein
MILCEPLKQSAFDLYVKYLFRSVLLKLVHVALKSAKCGLCAGSLKCGLCAGSLKFNTYNAE